MEPGLEDCRGSVMLNKHEVTPMRPLELLRLAHLAITLSVDEIAGITGLL